MDYSNYTLRELREGLASIDKEAYPENYQLLLEELNSRKEEVEVDEKVKSEVLLLKKERRLKLLSWLQIATAIAFLYLGITSFSGEQNILQVLLPFAIAIFNALAGYLLLKQKRIGFNLSFVNQFLQLFAINLGFVYYSYSGLGTLILVLQDGIALEASILSPVYAVYWGSDLGFAIGLDLVALFFLLILTSCREGVALWEK